MESAIPIIGEPQVVDWFQVWQVKCPCGHQFQLVGQPGAMRKCNCNRVYRMGGVLALNAADEPIAPLDYGIIR